ncbi:MAG: Ig-like domain-containing protein, partial [Planctomycetota bacterium]
MKTVSTFRARAVLILLAAMAFVLPQVGMANVAPVANDQDFYTRASELLAKSMLLAATDADHDPLTYEIVSGPSNGTLIGTPPRLEYLPDSTFRGIDSFTYRASDGMLESNIATVTIHVAEEACPSVRVGAGPTDSLFVHVPSQL